MVKEPEAPKFAGKDGKRRPNNRRNDRRNAPKVEASAPVVAKEGE